MGVRELLIDFIVLHLHHVMGRLKFLLRYKFAGSTVVDTDRNRDTAEFFNINKTDMITPEGAKMERDWPAPILESKPLFREYFSSAHSISMMIMNVLSKGLGIDPEEITSRHRFEERSGDHVRLIRGPPRKILELPEIQTPMHTDLATYVRDSQIDRYLPDKKKLLIRGAGSPSS